VLLHRFATQGDGDAFAALVQRYGPMVLGVCQRLLSDPHDAEDAFQAVFLILVRRAGSIGKPDLLAHWLYGVAYRVGARARATRARRRARERPVIDLPAPEKASEVIWSDLRPVLDKEVNRLPAKYLVPFVLCYLEGKTSEEAAGLLRSPKGTILSRLATARERLRCRLTRRGITLSAGLLSATLCRHARAVLSPSLASATAQHGAALVTDPAAGGTVLAAVTALAEGVQKAMFWSKVRTAAVLVLGTALTVSGALLLPGWSRTTRGTETAASLPQSARAVAETDGQVARAVLARGSNYLALPISTALQRTLLPEEVDARAMKACVLIDGMSIVRPDGTVDSKALDFDGLRSALKSCSGNGHGLIVRVYYPAPADGARVLAWALEGFGRQAGFEKVFATQTIFNEPYDWKKQTVAASDEHLVDADEPAAGDELVKVYPVRTVLSRLLTKADCVVVVPRLESLGDGLKRGVRESLRRAMGQLTIPRKDRVLFCVRAGSEEALRRFLETAKELAQALGFKASSVEG
jgi:RNA polymerase sigma factor (sigma-70 family)